MCDRLCLALSDLAYDADSQTWEGIGGGGAKGVLRTFEYHFKNKETTELTCSRRMCFEERYHLAKFCKLSS